MQALQCHMNPFRVNFPMLQLFLSIRDRCSHDVVAQGHLCTFLLQEKKWGMQMWTTHAMFLPTCTQCDQDLALIWQSSSIMACFKINETQTFLVPSFCSFCFLWAFFFKGFHGSLVGDLTTFVHHPLFSIHNLIGTNLCQ